jgi:hypothetical protein
LFSVNLNNHFLPQLHTNDLREQASRLRKKQRLLLVLSPAENDAKQKPLVFSACEIQGPFPHSSPWRSLQWVDKLAGLPHFYLSETDRLSFESVSSSWSIKSEL